MNSQQNYLKVEIDDAYIFPPNIEYAAEQQTQQQNTQYVVNNQIYPPHVEYQTIQQVYQPNFEYPVVQQTNQSNTEYQVSDQFYQSNADLNMESKPSTSTSLPQKEKRKRNRTKYTDEQIKYLEEQFKKNQYITLTRKKELAASLGMEEQQIKKWYQNRRMKESAKRKANCREDDENQRLPNQSIGYDHKENVNLRNSFQYNDMYPEATRREVLSNVNRSQNLGEPQEDNPVWNPQNSNRYYAYNNPHVYGNNLYQNAGVMLPTPPENFHRATSQPIPKEDNPVWNPQNSNHYYADNNPNVYGNNLYQNAGVILPTPPVNFNPVPLQQNHQNIYNNYYGNNSNENLTQNFGWISYPPLENINPLQSQEDQTNIFTDNVLPYNEDEQN